jgi:hypothetical protein
MTVYLPSLKALNEPDDGLLREELKLVTVRQQVAVARTLADQVEGITSPHKVHTLRAQLVEEMARLGCRLLEGAATLSGTIEPEAQWRNLARELGSARPKRVGIITTAGRAE